VGVDVYGFVVDVSQASTLCVSLERLMEDVWERLTFWLIWCMSLRQVCSRGGCSGCLVANLLSRAIVALVAL
jgi:hypothetical protein